MPGKLTSALLSAAVILRAVPAAADPSPAKIAADRQGILDDMLSADYEPSLIAAERRMCAMGRAPADTAQERARGTYFTPDAADMCVTALTRTGRDGLLADLYRRLLVDRGGNADAYSQLPGAIGSAVMGGATKVSIGNYKAEAVTPALAFDAGFTVAYQQGVASKPLTVDPAQLKPIAEACLAQGQDAGTCFSVGYVYGARAFHAGRNAP